MVIRKRRKRCRENLCVGACLFYILNKEVQRKVIVEMQKINSTNNIESWQNFVEQASTEQLQQAIEMAEHYYGSLVYLDELDQKSRQETRTKKASYPMCISLEAPGYVPLIVVDWVTYNAWSWQ
jgi:hypothetical protein